VVVFVTFFVIFGVFLLVLTAFEVDFSDDDFVEEAFEPFVEAFSNFDGRVFFFEATIDAAAFLATFFATDVVEGLVVVGPFFPPPPPPVLVVEFFLELSPSLAILLCADEEGVVDCCSASLLERLRVFATFLCSLSLDDEEEDEADDDEDLSLEL